MIYSFMQAKGKRELMKQANRKMKVHEQSGYHYKPTPTITLKGAWLEDWGFTANTPINIQCEDGKLTITKQGNSLNSGYSLPEK